MPTCDVCHNDYDKAFQVIHEGKRYFFDCIECAAQQLAPQCVHCTCRILGHGIEVGGQMFCCANCARQEGERGAVDRVGETGGIDTSASS